MRTPIRPGEANCRIFPVIDHMYPASNIKMALCRNPPGRPVRPENPVSDQSAWLNCGRDSPRRPLAKTEHEQRGEFREQVAIERLYDAAWIGLSAAVRLDGAITKRRPKLGTSRLGLGLRAGASSNEAGGRMDQNHRSGSGQSVQKPQRAEWRERGGISAVHS
jgi:hypothetical protein